MSHEAGKGDAMRPTNHEAFSAGMDRIFGGADPYAGEPETAALLVPDTRTPAERKLAEMIEANHGNEQGAELEIVLRQVALQLIDSDMPKVGCVNHDCDKCKAQPEQKPVAKAMTAHRAAYFMERFKHEEKLLGPNEQAALDFVISMLEAQSEQEPVVLPPGHTFTPHRQSLWIDPNDKTQERFLPNIGEPVIFCCRGETYIGTHTSGGFQDAIDKENYFNTWSCRWMPMPAAHGIKGQP